MRSRAAMCVRESFTREWTAIGYALRNPARILSRGKEKKPSVKTSAPQFHHGTSSFSRVVCLFQRESAFQFAGLRCAIPIVSISQVNEMFTAAV